MGDSHRTQGSDSSSPTKSTESGESSVAPRPRGLFGASRMDAVNQEREEAAASLRHRLSVMRKASEAAKPTTIPQGTGGPLPESVRGRMEPRLGADLSSVRLHTGGESTQAASSLGARAFTVGSDVHFNSGEFAPGTKEGDRLIAHELTHVVQGQRSGIQRKATEAGDAHSQDGVSVSQPDDPAEKEADAVADHVAGGLHAKAGGDKELAGTADSKAAMGRGPTGSTQAQAPAVAEAAPSIGAKLSGPRIFRSTSPAALPVTPAAPMAPANPKAKEIEAEHKTVRPVATLDEYHAMIQGLNLLVTPASKASVHLRFTKLKDAIARTKPKLTEIYKDKAPTLINDWIETRLAAAHPKPGREFAPKAAMAKESLLKAPAIEPALQVDAARPLTNYEICAPEEAATDQMMDESGGIMKVFDVNGLWWSMDARYQDAWKAKYGAEADKKFVAACKAKQGLVMAPVGDEGKPPFRGASLPSVFSKPLNGFVGQGKDAAKVASFADAIQRFALNPGYYPSGAMFVVSASAAEAKQKKNSGAAKIGKPSMFNLLNFDENVYKEDDRQYGHLADPKDASKAGNALELTCQGYPSEIFASAKFLG